MSGSNNERIQVEVVDDGEQDEGKEVTVENNEQINSLDALYKKNQN